MTVFLPDNGAPAYQVWSSGSQDARHRNTSKKPTLCYDLDLHMTQTYIFFRETLNLIQIWVAEDSRLNPFNLNVTLTFKQPKVCKPQFVN